LGFFGSFGELFFGEGADIAVKLNARRTKRIKCLYMMRDMGVMFVGNVRIQADQQRVYERDKEMTPGH
jgi:hypothetical protein